MVNSGMVIIPPSYRWLLLFQPQVTCLFDLVNPEKEPVRPYRWVESMSCYEGWLSRMSWVHIKLTDVDWFTSYRKVAFTIFIYFQNLKLSSWYRGKAKTRCEERPIPFEMAYSTNPSDALHRHVPAEWQLSQESRNSRFRLSSIFNFMDTLSKKLWLVYQPELEMPCSSVWTPWRITVLQRWPIKFWRNLCAQRESSLMEKSGHTSIAAGAMLVPKMNDFYQ